MSNTLTAFDAAVFSKHFVAKLDQVNVMRQLVNRDYEGEISSAGTSTVKVRILGNVTTSAYSGSISYQDLAPSVESFTVAGKEYFAFRVDDTEQVQSDTDVLKAYADRAAVALNNAIEAKIMGVYTSAATANKITGASSASIDLDKDNVYSYFVQAGTALTKQNVPQVGRWAVIDPDTYALILQAPEFIRSTPVGDNAVENAAVGNLAGFKIYQSNAIPTASGAKYLLFGDNYAISYAGQLMEVEMIRLQDAFATACRGLLVHDAKVFTESSKRLVTIKATI